MSDAEDTVIIDSGGANLASLVHALERQGTSARLARSPEALERASRAILPGVGAAGDRTGTSAVGGPSGVDACDARALSCRSTRRACRRSP